MEAGTVEMERPTHEGAPGEAPDEQPDPKQPELAIDAPRQLSLEVGGRAPDGSSVKLRSKKIDVAGAFEKGEEVTFVVRAKVAEVHFVDKRDGQTGEITATERRHLLAPVHIERLAD